MSYPFRSIFDDLCYVEIPLSGSTSNVYVLGSATDSLIVDSGGAATAEGVVQTLGDAGYRPEGVRAIWITHGHVDHYGGAAGLVRWCGAPVWASPASAVDIEDRWGAFVEIGAPTAKTGPAAWETFNDSGGEIVRVDRLVRDGDVVEHAGVKLAAIHMPGHHRGLTTLLDAERGIAIIGDLIQGGMDVSENWLGLFTDVASQRRSLARLEELAPRWLLKGHRQPRTGADVPLDLASASGRLAAIESVLLELLEVGEVTPAAATRIVMDRVLPKPPQGLPPYAVTTVTAFLTDLVQRGLATRTTSLNWAKAEH
ncbi:MAG: hypothetical protein BIFFINMI_01310 [Phycisphaerae bacterium]|nr:hypothetical protein [Phycisphaerae bacterium]